MIFTSKGRRFWIHTSGVLRLNDNGRWSTHIIFVGPSFPASPYFEPF